MLRRVILGGVCTVALFACHDIDTTHTPPPRGTIGEEVYGIVCDRVAAQALKEDLTGESFRSVCHKDKGGQWADAVDEKLLPPITEDAKDIKGKPVPASDLQANRERALARIGALVRRRADLVAALDAAFPDTTIGVKDLRNPDPTKSCDGLGEAKLGRELADMLGRVMDLYTDGTIPESTRSMATLMTSFEGDKEARDALARLSNREGYRPVATALGAARPMVAYPRLRDMANATLSLLSADANPYDPKAPRDKQGNRIPIAGPGHDKLLKVLDVAYEELRSVKPDAPLPALVVTQDAQTGRSILSRPRDNLEALQYVLYKEDPTFGSGTPRYIVKRDARGYASPARVNGQLPAPFVDKDMDGLADVDAFGQFVSSSGTAPPSPFFAPGAPDTQFRDTFGRALGGSMAAPPLYETIDTSHTFAAQTMADLRPLVDPVVGNKHESLMYMLGGLYVVAGERTPNTQRAYVHSDGATGSVTYDAYDPQKSPLVDLVHAVGQLIGDPATDDALVYSSMLMKDQTQLTARVAGGGLAFKDVANKHPEAKITEKSTLWDELIAIAVKIEKEPGLLEDVMRSLGNDDALGQGDLFGKWMHFKDRISYDTNNLNGPAWNKTTNDGSPPKTPVDRTKPDTGDNRSEFHRFLQVIHDGKGVAACNKPSAVVHARGIPIAGSIDLPLTGTYQECEVFKIDDLGKFFVQSLVGKARLYFRPSIMRNGIIGIGAATQDTIEQSSNIRSPGAGSGDCSQYWWDGSCGSKGFRPKPAFLNRLVFFDVLNDSPTSGGKNYVTNRFIKDLSGPFIGTAVCPERVINDPDPGAADAAPDGKVRGLRNCADGDWLQQRDADATFLTETFGAQRIITPLAAAFANRNREDLFVELMDALYRHWPGEDATDKECTSTGTPQTNLRYCAKSGASSYEELLYEALQGDLIAGLNALTKVLDTVTIRSCTTKNAQGQCTANVNRTGIQVMAAATRAAIDPDLAKAAGLTDRKGGTMALRNDGTPAGQVTPIYLLTGALSSVDKAFADFAALNPAPANVARQDDWRLGRSQLVDQFLSVNGKGTTAKFNNPAVATITPTLVDMLRAQLWARCPNTFATAAPQRCAWARDELSTKLGDVIKGPVFSTSMDLMDTIRADETARSELEAMLQYMVDAASSNEALAAMLASSTDMMQVLRDDQNLVPLLRSMAVMAKPGVGGEAGKSMVDAQSALLARISGKYFDDKGTEICAKEIDPNQILSQVLARLVTPMKDGAGRDGKAPVEVIMDVVADVTRADPRRTDRLDAEDYAAISRDVREFLVNKESGLEQFYAIVREATK